MDLDPNPNSLYNFTVLKISNGVDSIIVKNLTFKNKFRHPFIEE